MNVTGLDHLVLNVSDVERSLAWYTGMLGLDGERVEAWRSGLVPFPSVRIDEGCIIDLMAIGRSGQNVDHICLVVGRDDVDGVAADQRFDLVEGPVERWGAKGVGWSVYVRDPDGNQVELRSYD